MFIAVDDGFVINLRDFDTMSLFRLSEKSSSKKKISGGFLGLFPKFEEKHTQEIWQLNINYTNAEGKKTVYCISCPDRNELVKSARKVFKQLQAYDPSMINQAFEEAFFKDEKK